MGDSMNLLEMCTLDLSVSEESEEESDVEPEETDSTPVCLFCKKPNENRSHAVKKEISTEIPGKGSSRLACLFCTEENKFWCVLNRICVPCKGDWHKKRFNEFILKKLGSFDVCANAFCKGVEQVKHNCTRTGTFVCDQCNRAYSDKIEFEKHVKKRYEKYTCRRCSVSYCQRIEFNLHCELHKFETACSGNENNNDSKNMLFLLRDEQFPTCEALRSREVIQNSDEESHICLYCNEIFKSRRLLKVHYPIHKVANKFKCKYCDRSYPAVSSLITHIDKHENLRKHKCKYCIKRFNDKWYLKRHENSHENLRKFKCRYCVKAFNRKCILMKHERIHKDYVYCDKGPDPTRRLKRPES